MSYWKKAKLDKKISEAAFCSEAEKGNVSITRYRQLAGISLPGCQMYRLKYPQVVMCAIIGGNYMLFRINLRLIERMSEKLFMLPIVLLFVYILCECIDISVYIKC